MITPNFIPTPVVAKPNTPILFLIIVVLAITTGFWLSRLFVSSSPSSSTPGSSANNIIPIESISQKEDLKVGSVYGNASTDFKDTAIGTIQKGSINGEGTHVLDRSGGTSQRASLTSSTLDLDLFVDRKVEVRGETNTSTKTGWLLDVGSVKVLE